MSIGKQGIRVDSLFYVYLSPFFCLLDLLEFLFCRGRRHRRKILKETFPLSYFCMTKSTKSHLRGFSILLKIFFRRLAATSANTLSRPSRYSLTTATGSKRSSADSDLLLCHVRLWRTSRFKIGCMSGCEHSEMGFILIVPSAQVPDPRPPTLLCGRADNACTNLLGFFVRYVRTRGSMRLWGALNYRFWLCPLPHALATHGSRD